MYACEQGDARAKHVRTIGGLGACSPRKILKNGRSEVHSGAS